MSSEEKRWKVWEDSEGRLFTCRGMAAKYVDEYCFEVAPASEVERLREALHLIADYEIEGGVSISGKEARRVARAALAADTEPEGNDD